MVNFFEDMFIRLTEYANVTDGRTDRQTVGQTMHDDIGRAYA